MLLARRIMASIEAQGAQDLIGNFEGEPAVNALQKWGIPEPTEESEKRALAPFFVSMMAEDFVIPLPNIDQDPMKKLVLRVTWGREIDESFIISYLMAVPKQ
jgi:hypothetical protein